MIDPVAFEVGVVSRVSAALLSVGTTAYAAATLWYAWKAFQARLEDRWSAAFAAVVMAALAVLLAVDGAALLPAPFSVWVLAFYVGGIAFTLTYTMGRYQDRIDRFTKAFGARLVTLLEDTLPEERRGAFDKLRERWNAASEERRKTPHLMMAIFLAVYGALGFLIIRGFWRLLYGGDGQAAGEGIQNLYAASHADPGTYLIGGHVFGLFMLLALLFLIMPNELLRLRYPELSYPFKRAILRNLRQKERGLFGAHYYITATLPLAVLWLTREPRYWDVTIPAVAAVLAVTIFADAASALVGTRFGRLRMPHNRDKTIEGTIGGTIVAFAVALPFTGLTGAAIAAAVFLAVDVLGPVPVPVSDNILNPVALAGAFILARPVLDPLIPFY